MYLEADERGAGVGVGGSSLTEVLTTEKQQPNNNKQQQQREERSTIVKKVHECVVVIINKSSCWETMLAIIMPAHQKQNQKGQDGRDLSSQHCVCCVHPSLSKRDGEEIGERERIRRDS